MVKCWDVLKQDRLGMKRCVTFWSLRTVLIVIIGGAIGAMAHPHIVTPSAALVAETVKIIEKKVPNAN